MSRTHFLTVDLGASGGRLIACGWDGERFDLEEVHRFPNSPVQLNGSFYWDVLGIWKQIVDGLSAFDFRWRKTPAAIGVDAWGVDYALLDEWGRLIANPFSYRDSRTKGTAERLFSAVGEEEWYGSTGTQTMEINTLFQLYSMVEKSDAQLHAARRLLMIPDLFTYWLSGELAVELTEASTSQMYSQLDRCWAKGLLLRAGIPVGLLPDVVAPGTRVGEVQPAVREAAGPARPFDVIATASHDTASAVAAIPGMDEESAFLATGTWSLVGVTSRRLVATREAMKLGITNEAAADGGVLLIRNLTGFWILQQCLAQWRMVGEQMSWEDVVEAARQAPRFGPCIDPNHAWFQAPEDMLQAIRHYCQRTGQAPPEGMGAVARCGYESLAMSYADAVGALERLTGRRLKAVRMVGGGTRSPFFCQLTADALQRPLFAGPAEGSSLGNALVQAVATGHIGDLGSAQQALASSVEVVLYEPEPNLGYQDMFERFQHTRARLAGEPSDAGLSTV